MQNNQTLVIGLVVVAVLLAGVAGVVIYQQTQAVPAASPTATTGPTGTTGTTGATGQTGTTGDAAAAPAADVDPKSATKVPKGTEPKAFVEGYYKACDKGDWQAAFDALPADKKTGNSPDALKEQVSGYGIKGWTVTAADTQGDTATIKVDQETESYGTFENTWTFAKKDGAWLVTSKAVTGMK